MIRRLQTWTKPETRNELIPGHDHRGEIQALKRDRAQAMERDDEEAVLAIWAKIRELEGREVEPDRYEPPRTGRMQGDKPEKMTREEIRAELRKGWTVTVWPNGRRRITTPLGEIDEQGARLEAFGHPARELGGTVCGCSRAVRSEIPYPGVCAALASAYPSRALRAGPIRS